VWPSLENVEDYTTTSLWDYNDPFFFDFWGIILFLLFIIAVFFFYLILNIYLFFLGIVLIGMDLVYSRKMILFNKIIVLWIDVIGIY
jgi:hypothetical protein